MAVIRRSTNPPPCIHLCEPGLYEPHGREHKPGHKLSGRMLAKRTSPRCITTLSDRDSGPAGPAWNFPDPRASRALRRLRRRRADECTETSSLRLNGRLIGQSGFAMAGHHCGQCDQPFSISFYLTEGDRRFESRPPPTGPLSTPDRPPARAARVPARRHSDGTARRAREQGRRIDLKHLQLDRRRARPPLRGRGRPTRQPSEATGRRFPAQSRLSLGTLLSAPSTRTGTAAGIPHDRCATVPEWHRDDGRCIPARPGERRTDRSGPW